MNFFFKIKYCLEVIKVVRFSTHPFSEKHSPGKVSKNWIQIELSSCTFLGRELFSLESSRIGVICFTTMGKSLYFFLSLILERCKQVPVSAIMVVQYGNTERNTWSIPDPAPARWVPVEPSSSQLMLVNNQRGFGIGLVMYLKVEIFPLHRVQAFSPLGNSPAVYKRF